MRENYDTKAAELLKRSKQRLSSNKALEPRDGSQGSPARASGLFGLIRAYFEDLAPLP